MARRGFLDYVLGGAVGGLEGLAQKRAAEEERKRMADAAARQNMLDALTLEDRGFTEAGVRQERTKAATPAISAMLNTAMAMGRGAAPAGVLPDMSVLDKTAGMYGTSPAQTFTVGGKTYEKMQTKQEQTAMEQAQAEGVQDRQLQRAERVKVAEALRAATAKSEERKAQIAQYESLGYNKKEATMMTDNPSAFTAMRGQDISAATARQALAAASKRAGGQSSTEDGRVTLPSITEALDNFRKITPDQLRKISALGVSSASQGQQQGGFKELGLTGVGSLLGVIGDSEKRYAQQAGAIADAVARLSEVGVLTNFDVNRFRSQIIFAPGDSETLKQEKLKRAIAWGNWMSSNQKSMESGQRDKITATPESQTRYQMETRKQGESPEAYYARTGGR